MKLKLSLLALLTFMLGEGYLIYYFNFYLTKNVVISLVFAFMILGSISLMVYIDLEKLSKAFTVLSVVICITSSLFMVDEIKQKRTVPKPLLSYPNLECGKLKFLIDRNVCRENYKQQMLDIDKANKNITLENEKKKNWSLAFTDIILTIVRLILSVVIPFATHSISIRAKEMYEETLEEKESVKQQESVKEKEINESPVVKLYLTGNYSMYQIAKKLSMKRYNVEKELIERGLHVRNKRSTTFNNGFTINNNDSTTFNNEQQPKTTYNVIQFRKPKVG